MSKSPAPVPDAGNLTTFSCPPKPNLQSHWRFHGHQLNHARYDLAGNLSSFTNSTANATISYAYNNGGSLTSATSSLNDANHPSTLFSSARYGPYGMTSASLGNGMDWKQTYSTRGALQSKQYGTTSNTAAVPGSGSVILSGAERSTQVITQNAAPGTGYVTISGNPQTKQKKVWDPDCPCFFMMTFENSGVVTIIVNGFSKSVGYDGSSSSTGLAAALASAINGDGGSPVWASPSSTTVYLTSKQSGAGTNYSLSTSWTYDSSNFTGPAFVGSPSGPNLTGGQDAVTTTVYDTGTITITVNGFGKSVAYGQWSDSNALASSLASAFNTDGASPVSASAAGGAVTLTSKAVGASANYSLSSSSNTNNGYFSGTSFPATPSGSALTGGADSSSTFTPTYSVSNSVGSDFRITGSNDSINGNLLFGYDEFAHLNSSSGTLTYTWDFDPYGNRWHQNGSWSNQESFDVNNRGSGATYDILGNVTNDGLHTYKYDAENRIIEVDANGGTAKYAYDADGLRVKKTVGASIYEYVYDVDGNDVLEIGPSGTWTRAEVWQDADQLATYTNTAGNVSTYFSLNDWQGTPRRRTGPTGNVVESCTNNIYGENPSCSGSDYSPHHYTGYSYDSETQLYYANNRYYNPRLGRFMSVDLLAGDILRPQSLNRFSYVAGDPVNLIDPSGLSAEGHHGCLPCQFIAAFLSVFKVFGLFGHEEFTGSMAVRPRAVPEVQRTICGNPWDVKLTGVGPRQAPDRAAFTGRNPRVGEVAIDPRDFGYDDYYDQAAKIRKNPSAQQKEVSDAARKKVEQYQRELKNANIIITPDWKSAKSIPKKLPSTGPYKATDAIHPPQQNTVDLYRYPTDKSANASTRAVRVNVSFLPSGRVKCPK